MTAPPMYFVSRDTSQDQANNAPAKAQETKDKERIEETKKVIIAVNEKNKKECSTPYPSPIKLKFTLNKKDKMYAELPNGSHFNLFLA